MCQRAAATPHCTPLGVGLFSCRIGWLASVDPKGPRFRQEPGLLGWALTLTSVLGALSPRGRSRWGAWRGGLRGGLSGGKHGETRLGTHNPESSWAAALLTERLNGPEDPAALVGQDGDDRFPGVFPAPGSKPSALPAGPHSTPPPNCSWVAGHAPKHRIATRRLRAGKTSGRAPGDGQSSPHPGLDRSPQLTTCSTEAPFRRMMASVKSGLSAQTSGAGSQSQGPLPCSPPPQETEPLPVSGSGLRFPHSRAHPR